MTMNAPASDRPQLLVTVLDWGMGHATRTLPLIEHAIAADGTCTSPRKARHWPGSSATSTPPCTDVPRQARAGNQVRQAWQLPPHRSARCRRLSRTSSANEPGPSNFVEAHGIDAILSDNCYGCAPPWRAVGADVPPAAAPDAQNPRRPGPRPWSSVGPRRSTSCGCPTPSPGPSSLSGHLAARRRPPPHRAHRRAEPFGPAPPTQRRHAPGAKSAWSAAWSPTAG